MAQQNAIVSSIMGTVNGVTSSLHTQIEQTTKNIGKLSTNFLRQPDAANAAVNACIDTVVLQEATKVLKDAFKPDMKDTTLQVLSEVITRAAYNAVNGSTDQISQARKQADNLISGAISSQLDSLLSSSAPGLSSVAASLGIVATGTNTSESWKDILGTTAGSVLSSTLSHEFDSVFDLFGGQAAGMRNVLEGRLGSVVADAIKNCTDLSNIRIDLSGINLDGIFSGLGDGLSHTLDSVWSSIGNFRIDGITDQISNALHSLGDFNLSNILSGLDLSSVSQDLQNLFSGSGLTESLSRFINTEDWGGIKTSLLSSIPQLESINSMTQQFLAFGSPLGAFSSLAIGGLDGIMGDALSSLTGGLSDQLASVTGFLGDISGSLTGMLGDFAGFSLPSFDLGGFSLPSFSSIF